MKKLISLFLVLLVGITLTACGGTKEVTKTCTTQENGAKLEMIAYAPSADGDVSKIVMNVTMAYEDIGITKDDITDEMREYVTSALSESLLSGIGVSESDGSVNILKNEFDDTGYVLNAEIDVAALQKSLGTDENEDISLSAFVTEMEKSEMKCE